MALWTDSPKPRAALAPAAGGLDHLDAVERVKGWTRGRFRLGHDDTLLVSEVAGVLPGCPELQTAVAFWTADGTRHHFTVFKRVQEVAEDDIPPSWMRGALALSDGISCACC
jgi:nitrate reductase delta subunit